MVEVLDFIKRRFPEEDMWLTGNCYYFAKILEARFPGGIIYYDLVNGHFLYSYYGMLFDWAGVQELTDDMVEWDTYQKTDDLHYARIVRDVIL